MSYMSLLSDTRSLCDVNPVYLPDDVVDDLVNGKADVGVDCEHLSQRVFILCGVQVAIQQAAHHIQEGWVVLL